MASSLEKVNEDDNGIGTISLTEMRSVNGSLRMPISGNGRGDCEVVDSQLIVEVTLQVVSI